MDASSTTSEEAIEPVPSPPPPQAAAARPPWESPDLFLAKPRGSDYGYVANRKTFACSREELVERCRAARPHVDLVWTPEFPRMLPPAEVPWLLDAVQQRTHQDLRYNAMNGLGLTIVMTALAAMSSRRYPVPLLAVLVLMLGVVPAVQPVWSLRRLRRRPAEYPKELATTFRYQVWLGTRRLMTTGMLVASMLIVAAAQVASVAIDLRRESHGRLSGVGLVTKAAAYMGATAPDAGLDKKKVLQDGEVWRLLTCELLHGHPLHLLFNVMALLAVGRLLEVHGHPVYVPTVFLFSALCASAFSLYLTPTTSVGASGGIMGLIGFLAVIGLRRRHVVPRGFLRSIALSIAFTAATGLVAYHFIDNAAHLGGLVGGLMLGAVYVQTQRLREGAAQPPGTGPIHLAPSAMARLAGWVSGAALAVATVATVVLLLAAARQ